MCSIYSACSVCPACLLHLSCSICLACSIYSWCSVSGAGGRPGPPPATAPHVTEATLPDPLRVEENLKHSPSGPASVRQPRKRLQGVGLWINERVPGMRGRGRSGLLEGREQQSMAAVPVPTFSSPSDHHSSDEYLDHKSKVVGNLDA